MAAVLAPARDAPVPIPTPASSVIDHHHRSLDGLRAVAVLAVLCFHQGFGWARGGFLGVSLFFTLSGFLITSLLLEEHRTTGRIGLGGFYSRRLRRLMPASLLVLLGIVIATVAFGDAYQVDRLTGDVLSALAYVANWRFIFSSQPYEALFSAPSPVQHFWSLAIEEQFYLVFPVALVGALAVARGRRGVLLACAVAVVIVSSALLWVLFDPADTARAYYGTGTRIAEIAVGVALAILMTGRTPKPADARGTTTGVAALVLVLAAFVVARTDAPWLYHGGMLVFSLVCATLLVAALRSGPLARVLSVPALVALGAISYGVYVVHWPVFVFVDESSTGFGGWPLFGARLAITFAIAIPMYWLLEQPVRRRRALLQPNAARAAMAMGVVLVAVAAIVLPRFSTVEAVDVDGRDVRAGDIAAAKRLDSGTPAVAPPTSFYVVGDSEAETLVMPGLSAWAQAHGHTVVSATELGCGVVRGDRIRTLNVVGEDVERCLPRTWDRWPTDLGATDFDAVVVIPGLWDLAARDIAGDWRGPEDPLARPFLVSEYTAAVKALGATGAEVILLLPLAVDPQYRGGLGQGSPPYREADPAAVDALRGILLEVASATGAHTVDFQALLDERWGSSLDPTRRPDGVHLTDDASIDAASVLGPALLDTLESTRKTGE